LEAIRAAIGADHVLTDEDIYEFRDQFFHRDWTHHDPSAVVQPATVDEIQAVLRIAHEHGVPIWTNSQGRNLGLGGGSPRVRGTVVMNLRRMNRILEINEELGYAVVEPGVSWSQLYEALRDGATG
jgi:4-cresol dehydrogenase (hydroxylating)